MKLNYDRDKDELQVMLDTEADETTEPHAADFTVMLDRAGRLRGLTVRHAASFRTAAREAGIAAQREMQDVPQGMVWHDADSSMVSAYGYDPNSQVLDVAFHRTGVYRYYNVPPEVFEELHAARSKGSYLRGSIIDRYPWQKKGGSVR